MADLGSTSEFLSVSNFVSPARGYDGYYTIVRGTYDNAVSVIQDIYSPIVFDLYSSYSQSPFNNINVGPIIYYVMRGTDVDCGSLTYRTWTVSGSPDLTGLYYSGTKCGVSPLANIIITHRYIR